MSNWSVHSVLVYPSLCVSCICLERLGSVPVFLGLLPGALALLPALAASGMGDVLPVSFRPSDNIQSILLGCKFYKGGFGYFARRFFLLGCFFTAELAVLIAWTSSPVFSRTALAVLAHCFLVAGVLAFLVCLPALSIVHGIFSPLQNILSKCIDSYS